MSSDMNEEHYTLYPIGVVRSALTSLEAAPPQGEEGAPEAWLQIFAPVAQALAGITAGDETPLTGVFATRSPDRPNPVGLHRVSVREVTGRNVRVAPMEAIDGTPIVDIKPVLGHVDER